MSTCGRVLPTLGGLFLAMTLACASGCASPSSDDASVDATAADLSAAQNKAWIAQVRTAYENALKADKGYWLPGEEEIGPDDLPQKAADQYAQNGENAQGYGFGGPVAKVAKVSGRTVYVVYGILSDTGEVYDFYDAKGRHIAEAYEGQGARPNANGVDWQL